MYLRQRLSDGSVNKTILKPCLAAAPSRQYVYVGFSRRNKIPRSSAYTISEKAIRFLHPDYNPDRAQKLICSSMSRHLSTRNISSKSMHVFLSNLTNRDKRTQAKTCTSSFVPRNYRRIKVHNFFRYPGEIQKSSVNLVPGSGLCSGSSSKPNQFVQVPAAIDSLNFIEIPP